MGRELHERLDSCLCSCMKLPSIVPPIWTCPRREILGIAVKLDRRRWLFMMLAATFHVFSQAHRHLKSTP
eukprot:scaffold5752_cov54-Cyclotella_meneghiniana.AAC.8